MCTVGVEGIAIQDVECQKSPSNVQDFNGMSGQTAETSMLLFTSALSFFFVRAFLVHISHFRLSLGLGLGH